MPSPTTPSVPVPTHHDLAAEQAYLDRAHEHLAAMQATATRLAERFSETAKSDFNDAAVEHTMRRYRAALDVGGSLCFGRIDADDGDRWYIGRRHVEDDAGRRGGRGLAGRCGHALLPGHVRRPARPGAAPPLRRRGPVADRAVRRGLRRPRQRPRRGPASRTRCWPSWTAAAPARCATSSPRSRPSRTSSSAPRSTSCLVVQGGPGTGKTAVGLHRAALLLYDHREVLERDGVLVVGPNRLFLRYISQVLPSLGETSVVQTTVAGPVAARRARARRRRGRRAEGRRSDGRR